MGGERGNRDLYALVVFGGCFPVLDRRDVHGRDDKEVGKGGKVKASRSGIGSDPGGQGDRRFEARFHGSVAASLFKDTIHRIAHRQESRKLRRVRRVVPMVREINLGGEVHRFEGVRSRGISFAVPRHPRLFAGEAKDGRKPTHQPCEHPVEHKHRPLPQAIRWSIAIHAIFPNVEVQGRELDGTKIVRKPHGMGELIGVVGSQNRDIGVMQPMEHVAIEGVQLHVLLGGDRMCGEVTQQPAQSVANPAVAFGRLLED